MLKLHPTWKFGMFTHSEFPMKMKAFIVDSVSGDDIPILINKAKK